MGAAVRRQDAHPVPLRYTPPMRPPRVFISYSHDSPVHTAAVLELSDRLRRNGIDARLDRYEPWPTQGWPGWMRQQVGAADTIVCVCTATYKERFEGRAPPGEGLGASWEGWLAENIVYHDRAQVGRFVPVLLGGRQEDIPDLLRGQSHFDAGAAFDGLLRRLSGRPEVVMPPLGAMSAGMAAAPGASDRVHALLDLLEQAWVRSAPAAEVAALEERLRAAKGERGPDLQAGDVLGERYVLLRRLGEGGFATVWAAWERLGTGGRGRQVAIKVLHPHHHSDASKVRRFEKGAHDLAALSDPDLVRVITPCHALAGRHLFSMELLPGENLQQAVLSGACGPEEALRHCLVMGRALHRLHERQLIHRDVKPSNILLDKDRRPKLSDFDLARNLKLSAMSDSRTVGDQLFTAYEQYRNVPVDRRVDVYGLAMTALWCVARGNIEPEFPATREVPEVEVAPAVLDAILVGAAIKPAGRPETALAWCEGVERAMAAARRTQAEASTRAPAPEDDEPTDPAIPAPRRGPPEQTQGPAPKHQGAAAPPEPTPPTLQPGQTVHEVGGLRFVYIPGGTFQMGRRAQPPAGSLDAAATWADELPQHAVTLSPFAITVTPVTQAQWRVFAAGLNADPSHFKGRPDSAERPVEGVSWFDAVRWCNALSKKEGRTPVYVCDADKLREADGKTWEQWRDDEALRERLADAVRQVPGDGYRLPTEAEWEHACRAGTLSSFWSGETEADLARVGWYGNRGQPGGNSGNETHPVGQKPPNAWGLHDVHGNVFEWCGDWFANYDPAALTNPTGPSRGGWRVVRGGSFWSVPVWCRSAYRGRNWPVSRYGDLGFRVVLPLSPPPG
jgi:formylglycine-generating enzyme required for sulfatase activity